MQDQHVQNKLAVKYLNIIINFANFFREKKLINIPDH